MECKSSRSSEARPAENGHGATQYVIDQATNPKHQKQMSGKMHLWEEIRMRRLGSSLGLTGLMSIESWAVALWVAFPNESWRLVPVGQARGVSAWTRSFVFPFTRPSTAGLTVSPAGLISQYCPHIDCHLPRQNVRTADSEELTGFYFSVAEKLTGMTENSATLDIPSENNNAKSLCNCVYEVANVLQVQTSEENTYRFSGKTASGGADTLITLKVNDSKVKLTVNCEKMVICSMLLKDLKTSLAKAWWKPT